MRGFFIVWTVIALTAIGAFSSCGPDSGSSLASTRADKLKPDDVCVTTVEGFGPGPIGLRSLYRAPKCKTTRELSDQFRATSIGFGLMAGICGVVPEPLVTKGTAAILGLSSAATGTVSFVISKWPCEGAVKFSHAEELAIEKIVCEKMGKKLNETTRACK